MPITTRSRAPAGAPATASNSSTRPVKKDSSKQRPPKTVEKVQPTKETDHGSESSEDETPLALLKDKPAVPTKASKTKAAPIKTSATKVQENGVHEPSDTKGMDQTFVLPAKIASRTKTGSKKIVGPVSHPLDITYNVAAGVSDVSPNDGVKMTHMDETIVLPTKISSRTKIGSKKPVGIIKSPSPKTSKAGGVSDEEDSPVVRPRDPTKKTGNNQIQDESSETEEDISPKANIVSKKAKPVIIPLKPKKRYEELDIAPEVPASKDNGENEVIPTDESEDQLEDESEDSDKEFAKSPPPSKLHAAAMAKNANVNEVPPESADEDVDEAPPLNPPKRGRKKPVAATEPPLNLEDPAKLTKRGARKKETPSSNIESSNVVEDIASVEDTASAKFSKKPVKKATSKKETPLNEEGLSDLMNSLDLNEGASKKGKQKKGVAAAKSKARGKKTAETEESDSEPEAALMKYSSTESLKNVTMTRGMIKSVSEDNLHTMVTALPERPRRGVAKPVIPDPDFNEEPVKKSRAPRKKAGK